MKFRLWPDGTSQEIESGNEEPYPWMSDDYVTVECEPNMRCYESEKDFLKGLCKRADVCPYYEGPGP